MNEYKLILIKNQQNGYILASQVPVLSAREVVVDSIYIARYCQYLIWVATDCKWHMHKGINYIRLLDTATVLGQTMQNCSKIVNLLGYDYDGGCIFLTLNAHIAVNVCCPNVWTSYTYFGNIQETLNWTK